jgi:teichuronic acid biosynthesis glycosyltransferase TuaG
MMMKSDLVSIVTPVYNAERFIDDTIKSVQAQSYPDWELLLIDDCSTDDTPEVIMKYLESDPRIKYQRLGTNAGQARARNIAMAKANGRYIAFIDSDDIWHPNKLKIQLSFMKEKKVGFTFTAYEHVSENKERLYKIIRARKKVGFRYLLLNSLIGCSTVMLDRDVIGDIQMPLIPKGEDLVTWLRILKLGHTAYGIDKILTKYRVWSGSITYNKIKNIKDRWIIYHIIFGFSAFYSSFLVACNIATYVKRKVL